MEVEYEEYQRERGEEDGEVPVPADPEQERGPEPPSHAAIIEARVQRRLTAVHDLILVDAEDELIPVAARSLVQLVIQGVPDGDYAALKDATLARVYRGFSHTENAFAQWVRRFPLSSFRLLI